MTMKSMLEGDGGATTTAPPTTALSNCSQGGMGRNGRGQQGQRHGKANDQHPPLLLQAPAHRVDGWVRKQGGDKEDHNKWITGADYGTGRVDNR